MANWCTWAARTAPCPPYRTLFGGSSLPAMGVELPYGRGAFTAVIMMPQGEVAIRDWVTAIDRVEWAAWMAEFDARAETEDTSLEGIQVRLPRFEIESGSDSLVAALRALGMEDAFLPGAADFSRMTGTPDLFISQAFQKTYLRVDEAGTEAAAATAVVLERIQYSGISFHRPFLFAIRERFSGTILFIGVIGDPTA
jgi:serpin B